MVLNLVLETAMVFLPILFKPSLKPTETVVFLLPQELD
jgi:hypothetical protein